MCTYTKAVGSASNPAGTKACRMQRKCCYLVIHQLLKGMMNPNLDHFFSGQAKDFYGLTDDHGTEAGDFSDSSSPEASEMDTSPQ